MPKPSSCYETYHVPASGAPLFQAAVANFNPFGGETKVNTENPDRGPILIIAGDNDNTAPTAITHATAKYLAKHSEAITEIVDVPDRGHSLTIDHGWQEVAEIALGFVDTIQLTTFGDTDVRAQGQLPQRPTRSRKEPQPSEIAMKPFRSVPPDLDPPPSRNLDCAHRSARVCPRLLLPGASGATGVAASETSIKAGGPGTPVKPTIVFVHGAFADASGFSESIITLQRAGYPVLAPANPLRGLSGDADSLRTFLSTLTGPRSWSGIPTAER